MNDNGGHANTIRRIHGILRRALAQGVRWGWLGVNPAASASPPRVPRPDIAPPTPTQLGRLQAAIDVKDPEFGVFVRLSAMTGARRSEMLALRWPNIDLEHPISWAMGTTNRCPSRTVGISPCLTRSYADVREIPSMTPA